MHRRKDWKEEETHERSPSPERETEERKYMTIEKAKQQKP